MRRVSALVVGVIVALVAAAGVRASDPVPPGSIALVAGEPLPLVLYSDQIARMRRSYALRKKSFPAAGSVTFRRLRDTVVALLVFRVEVRQQAAADGVVVSDAEIDARVGQIEQQWGSSPRTFARMLKRLGLTRRALREDVRARLTIDAMRLRLKSAQTASDDEIAGYYSSHLDEFTTPATRRIRDIVVRTRKRALVILRRLRRGAAFAAMARRYSLDRSTRRSGGVLTVAEGAGDGALQRYAFSIRRQKLVGPVRFRDGWHVLEALGPVRPRRIAPLEEVAGAAREQVLNAKAGAAMARWLDDLKRDFADKVVYAAGFAPGS